MKKIIFTLASYLLFSSFIFGQEAMSTEKKTELVIIETTVIETPESAKKNNSTLILVEKSKENEAVPESNNIPSATGIEITTTEKKKIPPKEN